MRHVMVLWTGLITGVLSGPALAGSVYEHPPAAPDPTAHYLFYMHGQWLEQNPPSKPNKRYGIYHYREILDALADRGFTVISELRSNDTNPKRYAAQIMAEVEDLIAKGVPAENIVVSGFSKGGQTTLNVAAINTFPTLKFVVMAGCGIGHFRGGYEKFLKRDAVTMKGQMLSVYDADDQETGTCREASARATEVAFEEHVLHVGKGHGTFYAVNPVWLDKVASWGHLSAPPER